MENKDTDPNTQQPIDLTSPDSPSPARLNADQKELKLLDNSDPQTIATTQINSDSPRNKGLVTFLRVLVIGGGLFIVFVIGLGISFSACFTIKGPPPPECGPVSFVSLILMPGAALFFLIPLAKKIK